MENSSYFSPKLSNLSFNEDSIKIDENKETKISNLKEYENLIGFVKEKQKELSVVLDEIDKIKDEYKKLYNEKEMMKEYIGNLMEIHNKTTKR
ncbi:hypothetical protein PNEG_01667 [Pneumocystis murina B123]|uniref:Uncharacterized protein n=1 Tax=Pneumocystis murina (strain B123) TaxID=1069680 RepID=M7NRK6_PNEMU|nr:hypothetical protein PNEG_01667 [Pneumocystis murina B123]EMR09907.1 hypothetical protein PNEG_01667 [Pneumocystis murina B123]